MILENVQKRRKNLGLTQNELSKLSNVSQSTIAKIESGKISPSFEIAKKIFSALEEKESEKSIKALDVMSRKVKTIGAMDTVDSAIKLMKRYNLSQLPVFDKGHLVGVISERVIMENLGKPGLGDSKVGKIIDEAPPTISEDTPIKLLSELLRYNQIIVVYKQAELRGVVTKADLLKIVE